MVKKSGKLIISLILPRSSGSIPYENSTEQYESTENVLIKN
jgi:hypothetical protein